METLLYSIKAALVASVLVLSALLIGCQSDVEHDSQLVKSQWTTSYGKPITNRGKVLIKVEPFGSVKATVFQGQVPAYNFSVDREKPQSWLTGDIDDATIYLTSIGENRDGLVIDDEQTHKRYVLSFYDISDRLKNLPPAEGQTTLIKGYSIGLERLTPSIALN
jgi:hypothetical protein